MKMKIFNLLLRATGEDFSETQVMQQPRADYRLDCCLQAWIGTPSVFAGFLKVRNESSTGIPLTVKYMVFIVLAPKSAL